MEETENNENKESEAKEEPKEDKVEEKAEAKEEPKEEREGSGEKPNVHKVHATKIHESHNTGKKKSTPWIISTVFLAVIVIGFLVLYFTNGGMTGNVISKDAAGQVVLDFANAQTGGGIELVGVENKFGLYEVIVKYQDEDIPLYITRDGKNLIQGVTPLSVFEEEEEPAQPQATEVPKSDRPSVGLFIWSYCPYGVTALGPFAEVASLLEDSADFKVYLYYAGHGDFEVQQNKVQACIQKLGYDSYWDYSKTFADEIFEKCYGDASCNLNESVVLMKSLGIDSDSVLSCVDSDGETLLEEHYNVAKEVGVTGSPSLVINGVKANAARTAESFKVAVCESFNDAPSACETSLNASSAVASGSC